MARPPTDELLISPWLDTEDVRRLFRSSKSCGELRLSRDLALLEAEELAEVTFAYREEEGGCVRGKGGRGEGWLSWGEESPEYLRFKIGLESY